MGKYSFKTNGTCSSEILFEIDADGVIKGVKFVGGCNGNLQGISALATGRRAQEVAGILDGIRCGDKDTSCPDQLARALKKSLQLHKTQTP